MPVKAEVLLLADAASLERALAKTKASLAAFCAQAEGVNKAVAGSMDKSAAQQEAAHARIAKAAERSNAAFAKWGTVGAAAVIAGSVDMALKVESAATAIAKSSGTTVAAAQRIEDSFKSTSGKAEQSAAQIGDAYAKIAGELKVVEGHALSSGQAMNVMTAAMNLTDATGGELGATTESLGKLMFTYGMRASEAAKASDVLFNASKQTGISVSALTETLDRIHGKLGALSPTLGEVGGLMETLAKHGVTGRISMSALNGAFTTLISGGKKTEEMTKLLGLRIFDTKGHFEGLRSVIEQLQPKLAGYTQKAQLSAVTHLFGAQAAKQLLAVIHEGPAAYDRATASVQRHNAAADAARKQHETLQGRLKITKAEMENLGATIGQAMLPALQKLVEAVSHVVEWFKKHEVAAKALAGVITAVLGAAVLDFAVVKVAKFVKGISAIVDGLKLLAAKMAVTAGAVTAADGEMEAANATAAGSFGALAGSAVASMAKIGLAVGAAVLAVKGLENILGKVTGEAQSVSTLLGGNQPGENLREGEAGVKPGSKQYQSHFSHGQVEAQVFTDLIGGGLSQKIANGILKALGAESGLSPTATGSEGAYGLAQWLGSRRKGLEEYAGRTHQSGNDVGTQISYLIKELHGPERGTLKALEGAGSVKQVEELFVKLFERPLKSNIPAILGRGEEYGAKELPLGATTKKARHAAKKAVEAVEQNVAAWAEAHIGKFRESTGPNTGPELDKLQAEFHTRAAAWCAEFATTAALMGGANKAVRTASVATIREWAEQGSHGFKKGVGHTPVKGALMMFGDQHVGFVEAVHGQNVTTIEGNTSGGKVERIHRKASEGDYAMPEYHALKGMKLTDLGGKEFDRTVKEFAAKAKEHADAVKKHAEAIAEARKKVAEQAEHWKETFESLTEKMRELASSAAQAWNSIQTKAISAAHTGAIKSIEGGPVAAEIRAEEETDKRLSRERTEAANAKALKEAKATGDKAKIREAEEAITDFARAQDEERKREAVEAAKKTADEQEATGLERLAKETEAYEANLNRQLAALTKLLAESRISYAAYAADITAIMAGTGVVYKPEKGTGETLAGGPGGPGASHPVEGEYVTGPGGERIYRPPGFGSYGSGTGAPAVKIDGPVSMNSTRQVAQFSDRLAFQLRHG